MTGQPRSGSRSRSPRRRKPVSPLDIELAVRDSARRVRAAKGDGLGLWREIVPVLAELGGTPVEWNQDFLDEHYREQPELKERDSSLPRNSVEWEKNHFTKQLHYLHRDKSATFRHRRLIYPLMPLVMHHAVEIPSPSLEYPIIIDDVSGLAQPVPDRSQQLFKEVIETSDGAEESRGWKFVKGFRESYEELGTDFWSRVAVFRNQDVAIGRKDGESVLQLAFRGPLGSQYLEPWLKADGYVNAELEPCLFMDTLEPQPKVHQGFLRVHEGLIKQVVAWIADQGELVKTIEITGHSRGAALATLAAADLTTRFPQCDVDVVLFASPRVGDDNFRRACLALPRLRVVSFANKLDPVAMLPLESMGFKHVVEPKYLDAAFRSKETGIKLSLLGAAVGVGAVAVVATLGAAAVVAAPIAAFAVIGGVARNAPALMASQNPHSPDLYEENYKLYFRDALEVCQMKGCCLVSDCIGLFSSEVAKTSRDLTRKLDDVLDQGRATQQRIDAMAKEIRAMAKEILTLPDLLRSAVKNESLQTALKEMDSCCVVLDLAAAIAWAQSDFSQVDAFILDSYKAAHTVKLHGEEIASDEALADPDRKGHVESIQDQIAFRLVQTFTIMLQVRLGLGVQSDLSSLRALMGRFKEDFKSAFLPTVRRSASIEELYAKLPNLKRFCRLWSLLLVSDLNVELPPFLDNAFTDHVGHHAAVERAAAELAAVFAQYGVSSVTSVNGVRRTALHEAALAGHTANCQVLLAAKADTAATMSTDANTWEHLGASGFLSHLGRTALHYAAYEGHAEVCQCLLSANADMAAKDYQDKSPLNLAARQGHAAICQFLVSAFYVVGHRRLIYPLMPPVMHHAVEVPSPSWECPIIIDDVVVQKLSELLPRSSAAADATRSAAADGYPGLEKSSDGPGLQREFDDEEEKRDDVALEEAFAQQLQEEELAGKLQDEDERYNQAKLQWMWANASLLPGMQGFAILNPARWSRLNSLEGLATELEAQKTLDRPVRLRNSEGKSAQFADVRAAVVWLREDGVLRDSIVQV